LMRSMSPSSRRNSADCALKCWKQGGQLLVLCFIAPWN
jgi:hypothetical protein